MTKPVGSGALTANGAAAGNPSTGSSADGGSATGTATPPRGPADNQRSEFVPLFLPLVGRVREDEDEDEKGKDRPETGEETDRVPVIPWSDEDGDSESWDAGDLPWGRAENDDDDDPDDPDPNGDPPGGGGPDDREPSDDADPIDDADDGDWEDLGWAARRAAPEPAPVEDDFMLPAMSAWQRRRKGPAATARPENSDLHSGGDEPPPEELEELWARRRAEADARREELRQLREGRRRDEADDKRKDRDDDEGEKEIVPQSAKLLRQSDGVWGAGQEESGVIG